MREGHVEILRELIDMNEKGKLDRASFDDIPIQVYHHPNCPGVSSTTIKTILKKSWNHCGQMNDESESLTFGSAFHCFVNEPHLFNDQFQIAPFRKRRGADYDSIKEVARQRGKILLMQHEFKTIEVMSKKLFAHPFISTLFTNARYEITFFSRDAETGVLKKCRVDVLNDRKIPSDLKTTWDASEDSFRRDAKKFDYGLSAAFYLEIMSEYYGELLNTFYLIPCEKKEPHETDAYRVHPESIAVASDKIRQCLRKIAMLEKDPSLWRGYELGDKTIMI